MVKQPVEVNIQELEEILRKYLLSGPNLNFAIKIVGHPGVGKSSIVKQISQENNYYFIDTRLAFKENIDLGGYPVPDHHEKRMIYYRPRFIPPEQVPDDYNGIVWFLDEANRAHPTVIQTLFQIITEHTCGEHVLPEHTCIILAGNLGESDETVITDFSDAALDGRLAIFHLKPSAQDWLTWADRTYIHPSIIHYITLFPEKLWDEQLILPNPRAWHQVSQALKYSFHLKTEYELTRYLKDNRLDPLYKLMSSLIGSTTAWDFITQLTVSRQISTSDILQGDLIQLERMRKCEINTEDILWAISGTLRYIREKQFLKSSAFNLHDLKEMAHLLMFIAHSRKDMQISFFYQFIKDCGILTLIPQSVTTLDNPECAKKILHEFTEFLQLN
ncbi:MAG: ATP-binding protein [Desulfobacterales bacterium]|nr:ATP-binding protein [Desulfobacterales bacterium]